MSYSIDSQTLRNKLRELLNSHADTMAGGGCTDFSQYTKQCGVIEGLALAERELLDLVEIQKKSQGEEDE